VVGVDSIGSAGSWLGVAGSWSLWIPSARLLSRCGIVAAVSGCDVVAAALYLSAVAVVVW